MRRNLKLLADADPSGNDDSIAIVSFRDFYAFEQHVKTCRGRRGLDMIPQWYDQPVFYFSNAQSLVHGGAEISIPHGCCELDYELELGIVIGKAGRNIAVEDAWDHIAGFTIINDFSARDLQRNEGWAGPVKRKRLCDGGGA
jgi:fumarylacetoacetate (FAA) hydrolase